MSANPEISPIFARHDLLLRLLMGRYYSPTRMFQICIGFLLLHAITNYYQDSFFIAGPDLGLLEDAGTFVNIALALLWGYLLRSLLRKLSMYISRLEKSGQEISTYDDQSADTYKSILTKIKSDLMFKSSETRHLRIAFLLLLTLLYVLYTIIFPKFTSFRIGSWALLPDDYVVAWIGAVAWNLYYFVGVVGLVGWYAILTVFFIIRKSKDIIAVDVRINPLTYSEASGFEAVGDLLFIVITMVASGFVMALPFLVQWGLSIQIVLGTVLYGAVLILVFWLPLKEVHDSIVGERDDLIRRINEKFEGRYRPAMVQVAKRQSDGAGMKEFLEAIDLITSIENAKAKILSQPSWPMSTVRRYSGTAIALSPVFTGAIAAILDTPVKSIIKTLLKAG